MLPVAVRKSSGRIAMRSKLFVLAMLFAQAPLRADDGLVLFSDHFATLNPGWGTASANRQVSNNKLLLKPNANYSFSNIYSGNYFKDADIRVKVREATGGTDETAGLVFWAADTETYYVAQIRPDGLVGITRFLHGQQVNPVGYASNAAVNKGVGQVNELRVLTVGKSATLYVNDKQIATIKGFPPALGGRVGVHAESGTTVYTWEFSGLEVRQPAAGSGTSRLGIDDGCRSIRHLLRRLFNARPGLGNGRRPAERRRRKAGVSADIQCRVHELVPGHFVSRR